MAKYEALSIISVGVKKIQRGEIFESQLLSSKALEILLANEQIVEVKSKKRSVKKIETEVKDGGNMS